MDHLPLSAEEYTRRRIRVLSAAAILVIAFIAISMLTPEGREDAATDDTIPVLPPPSPEEVAENSILSASGQAKLNEIQEKFSRGELLREDAERMMEEVIQEEVRE